MMYNTNEEFVELNSMELDETVLNKKKKKFTDEELEEFDYEEVDDLYNEIEEEIEL